jgi:predicted GNAT family acetyltransferase
MRRALSTLAMSLVRHDEAACVFWLDVDGKNSLKWDQCPRVEYDAISPTKWNLAHTYTPDAMRGQGYAEVVVKVMSKRDVCVRNLIVCCFGSMYWIIAARIRLKVTIFGIMCTENA